MTIKLMASPDKPKPPIWKRKLEIKWVLVLGVIFGGLLGNILYVIKPWSDKVPINFRHIVISQGLIVDELHSRKGTLTKDELLQFLDAVKEYSDTMKNMMEEEDDIR